MKNKILNEWEQSARKTHRIWFDFCDHMKKWYYKEVEEYKFVGNTIEKIKTGKTVKMFDVTKMVGYECMRRVEKYAEKHPEIKIVGVDDELYSGSDLVLIPHPKHGITMIFIPQCAYINNQWFLYPNYLENLQKVLEDMKQEYSNFEDKIDIKNT